MGVFGGVVAINGVVERGGGGVGVGMGGEGVGEGCGVGEGGIVFTGDVPAASAEGDDHVSN